MSVDLKCKSFCAVAASIVRKVSLEQVSDSLSLLLRQFSSNLRATKRAYGCKPSRVAFIDNAILKIYISDFH